MSVKVGRNDPCPCGSGKKFKKCCIEQFESSSTTASEVSDPGAPAAVLVKEPTSDRWTIELRNFAKVREAGPDAMADKPTREWSKTDEEVDESFPASDPPSNY